MEWFLGMAGLCSAGAFFGWRENTIVGLGLVLFVVLIWINLDLVN